MLEKILREISQIWHIIVAIITMAWFLSQANSDINSLKVNDERQDLKLEAINSDITQIKVDTSYIRARIDGVTPRQIKYE